MSNYFSTMRPCTKLLSLLGFAAVLALFALNRQPLQETDGGGKSVNRPMERRSRGEGGGGEGGQQAGTDDCVPDQPCAYQDQVDLRVIVITYNRPTSLAKLLRTLDDLEMDGHRAAMEIWIDRNKNSNAVDAQTLQVASSFNWTRGRSRVHVQKKNVGIYGQWIDTWKPADAGKNSSEIALILEDDLNVSPYAYRWLRAVFNEYRGRNDFAGATLQSEDVMTMHDAPRRPFAGPKAHTVFMFKCMGSWGFSPEPNSWRQFQDWFHSHKVQPDFRPYIPGTVITRWYKLLERGGRANTMWTMWYIYYTNQKQLFTVFSNLRTYDGDKESCLCINRQEIGLHYHRKGPENRCRLLSKWKDEYVKFPGNATAKMDWSGRVISDLTAARNESAAVESNVEKSGQQVIEEQQVERREQPSQKEIE